MSYNSGRGFSSIYQQSSDPASVGVQPNVEPKFNTLGHYNSKTASERKIYVVPAFGGSGYSTLQNNIPQTDLTGKYFSLQQAYPCAPSFPFPKRY